MNRALALSVLLALTGSAGCGGGGSSFGPTFPDNRASDIDAVLARLQAAPARQDEPVAAGITSAGEVYVVGLRDGNRRWKESVSGTATRAPVIAGDYVVTHAGDGVTGRGLVDGRVRFQFPDEGLHLMGGDGEGGDAAFVLSTGGGVSAISKLVVVRGGSVAWSKEIQAALGVPAVAGNMIFVPWATQNVSVLDLATGDEIARMRVTDSAVGHAFRQGAHVFVAQRGVFQVTPAIASGTTEGAAYFEPMLRDIPGNPSFTVDPYRPPPPPESAVHRIRYEWRAMPSGDDVALADGVLYGAFYKIVFGLDPSEDAVKWVYEHDHDIVGGAAVAGGLWVADAEGGLAFVSAADGRRHFSMPSDIQPLSVTFRAGDFTPPSGAPEGDTRSLHDQLLAAAQNADARLVPARVLAVHMLRAMPEDDVTGHLIALCEDRRAPPAVQTQACEGVAARETGEAHVVEALSRHTRYLAGTTAPPLGALARAAVTMRSQAAVPHLIAHLRDPGTTESDLEVVIRALAAMEAEGAVAPLRDFLRLYHAEATTDALRGAVGAAADALLALQGDEVEDLLREVQGDPLAPRDVQDRLAVTITALETARAEAEAAAAAEAEGEGEGEGEEGEGETEAHGDTRPDRVTRPMIDRVIQPMRSRIHECIQNANERNARVVLVLDAEGAISNLSIRPAAVRGCVEPLIRSLEFPGNRRGVREQFSLTLR